MVKPKDIAVLFCTLLLGIVCIVVGSGTYLGTSNGAGSLETLSIICGIFILLGFVCTMGALCMGVNIFDNK